MISVIVCNQASAHLAPCLESVRVLDAERILIDWGMDPPAGEVEGFRVVRYERKDWNHPCARNAGIAHATGDRLCFINSDCVVHPDILREAERYQGQIYWRRYDLTEEGTRQFYEGGPWSAWQGEVHGPSTYGDFLLVDKEPVVALGGYDERCAGWGVYDHDLACRLDRIGVPRAWGEKLMLAHLWHPRREGADADWRRNIDACQGDFLAHVDVRNEGRRTFGKWLNLASS